MTIKIDHEINCAWINLLFISTTGKLFLEIFHNRKFLMRHAHFKVFHNIFAPLRFPSIEISNQKMNSLQFSFSLRDYTISYEWNINIWDLNLISILRKKKNSFERNSYTILRNDNFRTSWATEPKCYPGDVYDITS